MCVLEILMGKGFTELTTDWLTVSQDLFEENFW